MPKKNKIEGCVKDWSMKQMTGLNEEQSMKLLTELEGPYPSQGSTRAQGQRRP